MNAIGRKRLLKLADFLDTLPREKFDFGKVAEQAGKPMLEALKAGKHRCGTVACAVGWMPAVFPQYFKWEPAWQDSTTLEVRPRENGSEDNVDAAGQFFGLMEGDADRLFVPNCNNDLGTDATPREVARHIRAFVREQLRAARPAPTSSRRSPATRRTGRVS